MQASVHRASDWTYWLLWARSLGGGATEMGSGQVRSGQVVRRRRRRKRDGGEMWSFC